MPVIVWAEIVVEAVTETLHVPAASVQLPALKVSPAFEVIVTVPVGVDAPAPAVSATVTVTVPVWPVANVVGLSDTVVELERLFTVNDAVPLLAACVASRL